MHGRKADFAKIQKICEEMRNPGYTLKNFFDDCAVTFPELELFLEIDQPIKNSTPGLRAVSTGEAEYQRTIGALFAVYWLVRLPLDGKEGFCYGVDDSDNNWGVYWPKDWELPPSDILKDKIFYNMTAMDKRASFLKNIDWNMFHRLVDGASCGPGKQERLIALLCLTAFHDIMKVEELQPTLQPEHAPFRGFKAGEVINESSAALYYVLEYYPELLPSYQGLAEPERKAVKFSQCKMNFNHGWFVQAEGPPGAALQEFKKVLANGTEPEDVGFYFLHWVCDLAGGSATPLAGAEKFVLNFPHTVLGAFLWSVPFVERLCIQNETEVMEDYLHARWGQTHRSHPPPTTHTRVAQFRLSVMGQGSAMIILNGFRKLPKSPQKLLGVEMARTGIANQGYGSVAAVGGPAICVQYGSAMIQKNSAGVASAEWACGCLAEVYRAARAIWPVDDDSEGVTVVVKAGPLKTKAITEIMEISKEGLCWVLFKESDLAATVDKKKIGELNIMHKQGIQFQVLDFKRMMTEEDVSASFSCKEEEEMADGVGQSTRDSLVSFISDSGSDSDAKSEVFDPKTV